MPQHEQIIHIQAHAPGKPVVGAPCNGCGICCLVEPCPLGMLLSRRRSGACAALRWNGALGMYRCGAIESPREVLMQVLPRGLHRWVDILAPLLARWAVRWIAARTGCDSNIEAYDTPHHPADGAQ